MAHDGFASYDRFAEAIHQQGVAPGLRRARELLATATRGAVRFPRVLIGLLTEAVHLRNECRRDRVPAGVLAAAREDFDERLLAPLVRPRVVPAYGTLANHQWHHFPSWFTFLSDPSVPATNWEAEQAIRPAVVTRRRPLSGCVTVSRDGVRVSEKPNKDEGVRRFQTVSDGFRRCHGPHPPKP